MSNLAEQIMEASRTSFIDMLQDSDETLCPRLLYNDVQQGNTVLSEIEHELLDCDTFWMSVAFVTQSGLIALKPVLQELKQKNPAVKGKILTTNYLEFNEPRALRDLLGFDNLEVRIFTREDFHTKGYLFVKDEKRTLIVGSSNLTQKALKSNKEWNLKVTSLEQGALIQQTEQEFINMWNHAQTLTEQWITEVYEPVYKEKKKARAKEKIERIRTYTLEPNKMQVEATNSLSRLRLQGKDKALLISATGTGKTYLSAFDVRNLKPHKMLFLVHRDRILDQAIESYKDVLGEGIRVGKLSSQSKQRDYEADYIFASMATMAKEEHRAHFERDYFDYIIIDEAHRAAADSYQKILEYFSPKFLLGMTATPELTNGEDIYDIFDHNIAYEIRLQQALEENLLCPFHYFGISELWVEDDFYDDKHFKEIFSYLTSEERVSHIIRNLEYYGHSGDRARGLIFCRRIEEAEALSDIFNQRGYRTMAVSSRSDMKYQGRTLTVSDAIDLLEQENREGGLDYIFTVDMFNEGVDICNLNQIVMLRPTQSPIVFVQQLGRGLRKAENKEYVVVLDFIGNYCNNFMIPIALSGDRTYNKDNLRRYVMEGSRVIPGCSTIHFDKIAKERIFHAIDKIKGIRKIIRESYDNLKYKLGRIPSLADFYDNGEVDPIVILNEYKTYYSFLKSVEKDDIGELSDEENNTLEYLSRLIPKGQRPQELLILKKIMAGEPFDSEQIKDTLLRDYHEEVSDTELTAAYHVLEGDFVSKDAEREKYIHFRMEQNENNSFYQRMTTAYCLVNRPEFQKQVKDLLTVGFKRYQDMYANGERRGKFVLYQKYSRRDVCLLLNWGKDYSSTMYGMKRVGDDVAIFVTYHKAENAGEKEYLEGKPDYADKFSGDSKQIFMWDSQIGKGPDSSYMADVKEAPRKHLFIKKSDAEGTDFYYLGLFDILEIQGDFKKDNNGKMKEITKVKLKLRDCVREDLWDYFESR